MVLAQNPEIITLDEPTAGMTADETYKTGELILNVMKDKTLIVVEHDIDFVKQISEKITVLSQGEILAEGSYDDITSNPEVVSVSYGKSQVVYNVSFEIKDDEKLILLGRNGVGKTTLLKSIIGLLPAKTGDISLNSDKVTKLKPYERSRKGIAYVPQGREIIPQLTVQENLELGALAHKVDYAKKVEEIFEYFPVLTQHLKRLFSI